MVAVEHQVREDPFRRALFVGSDFARTFTVARAGYDPRAGITLWQKMAASSQGSPPQWLSTHPAGNTRIADIERNLPKVLPIYERERKE